MSILDRIRANGGEVIRDKWGMLLRKGRLSAESVKWIAEHRDDLMREIWPVYDDWEERAAIREYSGGMSREDAEAAAYEDVGYA